MVGVGPYSKEQEYTQGPHHGAADGVRVVGRGLRLRQIHVKLLISPCVFPEIRLLPGVVGTGCLKIVTHFPFLNFIIFAELSPVPA